MSIDILPPIEEAINRLIAAVNIPISREEARWILENDPRPGLKDLITIFPTDEKAYDSIIHMHTEVGYSVYSRDVKCAFLMRYQNDKMEKRVICMRGADPSIRNRKNGRCVFLRDYRGLTVRVPVSRLDEWDQYQEDLEDGKTKSDYECVEKYVKYVMGLSNEDDYNYQRIVEAEKEQEGKENRRRLEREKLYKKKKGYEIGGLIGLVGGLAVALLGIHFDPDTLKGGLLLTIGTVVAMGTCFIGLKMSERIQKKYENLY